jgi:hypothetical protein
MTNQRGSQYLAPIPVLYDCRRESVPDSAGSRPSAGYPRG